MATYTVIPAVDQTGFHVAIVGSDGVLLASRPTQMQKRGFHGTSARALPQDMQSRLNQRTEQVVRDYCCHFLDERGYSLFPADISAEGLEAAKLHCFAILEQGASSLPMPPRGIEIWEGDVLLFRA
jgi:hypothetical protein